MPLTRNRHRMVSGALPMVHDYDDAANGGVADARTAIAAAAAQGACYFAPGTYLIGASISIPGELRFARGAVLKPVNGAVVTFTGTIVSGKYKIFDTSLGGSFVNTTTSGTATPITEAYPEWWGATGFSGNQSPFIQAAINFLQGTTGGTVYLSSWYTCQTVLTITGRVRIEGYGPVYGTGLIVGGGIQKSATLDFSAAASGVGAFLVQNATAEISGFELINVGIFRNPPEPKTVASTGLSLVAVQHFRVVHCCIFGFAIGVQLTDHPAAAAGINIPCVDGVFDNCYIGGGGRNSLVLGGCAGISFRDCVLSSGEANIDQMVVIGRGLHGMKADTVTFADCRIIYLGALAGRPLRLVLITDGMWINFIRTDIEESKETGILIQRDATAGHQDIGLKAVDISNCWFNGTGRNVVFSGFRASGRISDCRMENAGGGASNIALEFTTLLDADIVIRGNNIRSSGASGGIVVGNASGIRITDNYIYAADAGAAMPGITLTSTAQYSIVSSNRVRSNHASPISNAGTNNVVSNNVTTGN